MLLPKEAKLLRFEREETVVCSIFDEGGKWQHSNRACDDDDGVWDFVSQRN